jgi:hypothetical protein
LNKLYYDVKKRKKKKDSPDEENLIQSYVNKIGRWWTIVIPTIFIIFLNRVVFCLLLFVVCFRHISCVTNVFVISLVWPMLSVSLDCFRHISCVTNVASVSGLFSSYLLCDQCCQCLWIVFFISLVWSMLPVSLDCFLHISCVTNVASVSGWSIFDCTFGFCERLVSSCLLVTTRTCS